MSGLVDRRAVVVGAGIGGLSEAGLHEGCVNTRPRGSLFPVSGAFADEADMSMTGNSSRVVAAGPADVESLISVMVLTFAGVPAARLMYRDPQRYLAYLGRFIRAFASKAFSTGTAWCIDGHLGGALWLPPDVRPDEDAIAAIVDESVPRDVMADVNAVFAEMAAYHPRNPHWYLPTIGIERHLHRMGLGSALLAKALGRATRSTCPPISNPAIPRMRRFIDG